MQGRWTPPGRHGDPALTGPPTRREHWRSNRQASDSTPRSRASAETTVGRYVCPVKIWILGRASSPVNCLSGHIDVRTRGSEVTRTVSISGRRASSRTSRVGTVDVRPELDRPAVGEPGGFHPRQWIAALLAGQSGPYNDGNSRRSPDGLAGVCRGCADRHTAPVDGWTPSRSTTHAPDRIRQDRRRLLPDVVHVREARPRSSSTLRLADQVGCASDRSRRKVKPTSRGTEAAGGTTPLDRRTLANAAEASLEGRVHVEGSSPLVDDLRADPRSGSISDRDQARKGRT